ncbi:MAG: glutamine-hydrolyzing carbamoyl-phosphate synthase small subunit [Candidatus Peribacteraceae bacterium]|nr:glutamine-hydrolyzing carbamoyl-phosphate synthase small subunit [Candidatus Peribacteraceae bacterium]
MATLILSDGTTFKGESFGAKVDTDGEVVFNTGMAGYPESLTDPSYRGQILTFTYPLIGNYGVPSEKRNAWGFSENLESEDIHVRGVVVAQLSDEYSHHAAVSSLHNWLEHHKIPGITGIDTRALTKKLREHGVMLGRIVQDDAAASGQLSAVSIEDPNLKNLVAEVSCTEMEIYDPPGLQSGDEPPPTVIAYDCGIKRNILRSLLKRGVRVVRVPWDFDLDRYERPYQALFFSNGPGDPKACDATIANLRKGIERNVLTFGICLGNQLMALAAGGDTYKLKYGHRGCNQPAIEIALTIPGSSFGERGEPEGRGEKTEVPTGRCIITSQNHGFAVKDDTLPKGWSVWWRNGNDGSVEGIRHESGRFFSVQFHPEAAPGPEDANYLFDDFVRMVREEKAK